jgi:hypothetical protein
MIPALTSLPAAGSEPRHLRSAGRTRRSGLGLALADKGHRRRPAMEAYALLRPPTPASGHRHRQVARRQGADPSRFGRVGHPLPARRRRAELPAINPLDRVPATALPGTLQLGGPAIRGELRPPLSGRLHPPGPGSRRRPHTLTAEAAYELATAAPAATAGASRRGRADRPGGAPAARRRPAETPGDAPRVPPVRMSLSRPPARTARCPCHYWVHTGHRDDAGPSAASAGTAGQRPHRPLRYLRNGEFRRGDSLGCGPASAITLDIAASRFT